MNNIVLRCYCCFAYALFKAPMVGATLLLFMQVFVGFIATHQQRYREDDQAH